MIRAYFDPLLERIAYAIDRLGITPNQLTILSLCLSLIAGNFFASGLFPLGGGILAFALVMDILDGALARTTQQDTFFGAFLDSTVDRYADFFIYGGITTYFAQTGEWRWALLSAGILLGAYITSYAKARIECLIESCWVGILARPRQMMLVILIAFIPQFFKLGLIILLIGTHLTAIQRMVYGYKNLT